MISMIQLTSLHLPAVALSNYSWTVALFKAPRGLDEL